MKRYIYILIALVIFCGCSAEEKGTTTVEVGMGSVKIISNVDTEIIQDEDGQIDEDSQAEDSQDEETQTDEEAQTDEETQTDEDTQTDEEVQDEEQTEEEDTQEEYEIFEIPSEYVPTVDDLTLHITGSYMDAEDHSTQKYDQSFGSVNIFNEDPYLWSGEYSLSLSNGNDPTQEGEDNACFYTDEVAFTVEKDLFDMEIYLDVKLRNSIVRLKADEWFKSYFSSATFTVTTQQGSSFVFDPFDGANDDRLIFVEADSELKLKGVAVRASSGSEVTFEENVVGTTISGGLMTFSVKAESVGGVDVEITINGEIVEVHEENFELNPIE